MPILSPRSELADIRQKLRLLRVREAELLLRLNGPRTAPMDAVDCRPGWPMQRVTEIRIS